MVGFLSNLKAHARFCPYLAFSTFYAMASLMVPQSAHALCLQSPLNPSVRLFCRGPTRRSSSRLPLRPWAYQWRFNGGNVSGATNATLTITNVQAANTGPYSVVITNASGVVTSSPATLALADRSRFPLGSHRDNGVSPNYAGYTYAGDVAADNEETFFVAGMFGSRDSTLASIDFGGGVLTNNSPQTTQDFDQRHILSPSTTISATSPGRGRSPPTLSTVHVCGWSQTWAAMCISRDDSRELQLRNQYADEFGHARYLPGQVQFSG